MKNKTSELKAETMRRCWIAAALLAACLFGAAAANAQRLWTLGEVTRAPDGPRMVMDGDAVGTGLRFWSAGSASGEASELQVDLDLLRSAPARLELPTPGGDVLVAELSVFKAREDGDAMWSGRVAGANHDGVVLTVAGGGLAGTLGEPLGAKFRVGADSLGSGAIVQLREAVDHGAWCGVGTLDHDTRPHSLANVLAHRRATALHSNKVASASGAADGLKLLVLYTDAAARVWDSSPYSGGTRAALQNAADYLTMVFRNGELPLPSFVFEKAPAWLEEAERQEPVYIDVGQVGVFGTSGEIQLMRRQAGADHVHLFFDQSFLPQDFGGMATTYGGASTLGRPATFSHEVGHDLGGNHQPGVRAPWREQVSGDRQYGFAHAWHKGGAVAADGERGAYGSAVAYPSTEPYFSTVRTRPGGQQIGIAGERENERLFRSTVHEMAGRSVRERRLPEPATGLQIGLVGERAVRLRWADNSDNESGFYANVIPHKDWDAQILEKYRKEVGPNESFVDFLDLEPGVYTATVRSLASEDVLRSLPECSVCAYDHGFREFATFWIPGDQPAVPASFSASLPPGQCQVAKLAWKDRFLPAKYSDLFSLVEAQVFKDGRLHRRAFLPAGAESYEFFLNCRKGWYAFRVHAHSWRGRSVPSETVNIAVGDVGGGAPAPSAPTPLLAPPPPDGAEPPPVSEYTSCVPGAPQVRFGHGYNVSMCVEYERDGVSVQTDAIDYGLRSGESGLLYFFDRDNAEVLIKVLDACGVNGYRWVFVAPVTTLAFNLYIDEAATGKRWKYRHLRRGETAGTRADVTAFPCVGGAGTAVGEAVPQSGTRARRGLRQELSPETGALKAAEAASPSARFDAAPTIAPVRPAAGPVSRLASSTATDCVPSGPALTLSGGYKVSMCYETYERKVGEGLDWGLDSSQSALLYFFDRNNVEVLIKVLDGCGVNGHRWVFVAPVTDLAFNLIVESPSGKRWTHSNRLGRTADAASDVSAFPCTSSA